MSILIRDMEMPKRCFECSCLGEMFGYFVCLITAKDMRAEHGINISRPDWCPLVEIPTPHGDLVDRNELLAEYDRQHEGEAGKARKIMEQAKTVIEAEGGKE